MARGRIYQRGQTWTVVVDVGRHPETRKRRQKSQGGFRTKKEAQRWLTQTLGQVDQGTYVTPTRELTGEYLDRWLAAIRSSKKPSTFESYERLVRGHLIPRLGHVYLHQLSPAHLSAAYADMERSGRLDGTGGLSPRMVHYAHTVLRKALADAVEEGRVARNVAALGTVRKRLPKPRRPEHRTWTAEELGRFLDHVSGDPLYPALLLAATTGLRRGELLGLRWVDLDLGRGRAAVRQTLLAVRDVDADIAARQLGKRAGKHRPMFGTPKTDRERTVPLPARTVAALRRHRKRQLEDERMKAGPDYRDQDLVFAEPDGSPIHPERFAKRFRVRVAQAGVPVIRFHDLRHTWATLALQAGVHPKVVQEVLGHSNIAITLGTYSHAIPSMQEQAADTVAALVFGGS
jgi:integrase